MVCTYLLGTRMRAMEKVDILVLNPWLIYYLHQKFVIVPKAGINGPGAFTETAGSLLLIRKRICSGFPDGIHEKNLRQKVPASNTRLFFSYPIYNFSRVYCLTEFVQKAHIILCYQECVNNADHPVTISICQKGIYFGI
jgi:hypothetical protein